MRYLKNFPQDQVFTWEEMKPLNPMHYVLMHSIIYRTGLLRECGLRLPEHTFYVDDLYAFEPFVRVRKMYYVNANFYRYFIGREDQSVNEEVMKRQIDQQIQVNVLMIDFLAKQKVDGNRKRFLIHSLGIIMIVTSMMLIRIDTEQSLKQKTELWKYLRSRCPWAYHSIRWSIMGGAMHAPGAFGRKMVQYGYKLVNKFYGFN